MKTLYFESAGAANHNGINCRIRTAFLNDNNDKIYIEILTGRSRKKDIEHGLYCDFCHYITDDPKIDDCNESRLPCERKNGGEIEYTAQNILEFVNKNCNCSYDEIVILDNLAGYRAHADRGTYNLMNNFEYDEELTNRRIAKAKEISEHYKQLFNTKYESANYYIEDGHLTVWLYASEEKLKAAGIPNRKYIVRM